MELSSQRVISAETTSDSVSNDNGVYEVLTVCWLLF